MGREPVTSLVAASFLHIFLELVLYPNSPGVSTEA